jgi:Tfp pilus assembly PilM family ATPase
MSYKTNSISFHEDFVLWTDLILDENTIKLNKVVSDSLPRIIDHETINDSTFSTEITELIKTLRDINQFDAEKIRISLSNKFSMIKKIRVDKTIPAENFNDLVLFELDKSWEESSENYNIYLVEEIKKRESYTDLLVVIVRKNVLNFFENVFESANFEVEVITPSCFIIDEFYRKLYTVSPGEVLLLGWQRRGYDILISNENSFINYSFKPYNSDLDSIEQLDD